MRLSDAEYGVALEAEEVRTALPSYTLEVLAAAAGAVREPRHERLRTQLAALQAGEQLLVASNGLVAARKLLLQVGDWDALLGAAAGKLLACCRSTPGLLQGKLLAYCLLCCKSWRVVAAGVTAACS